MSFSIPENPARREESVAVRQEVLEELELFVEFVQERDEEDAPRDLVVEGILEEMLERSGRRELIKFRKWRRGELESDEGEESGGEADESEATDRQPDADETGEFEVPEPKKKSGDEGRKIERSAKK